MLTQKVLLGLVVRGRLVAWDLLQGLMLDRRFLDYQSFVCKFAELVLGGCLPWRSDQRWQLCHLRLDLSVVRFILSDVLGRC